VCNHDRGFIPDSSCTGPGQRPSELHLSLLHPPGPDFRFLMRVRTMSSRRQFLRFLIAASLAGAGTSRGDSAVWGYALEQGQAGPGKEPPEGAIEFESSDATLVNGFRWARAQALAYARSDGSIGPWYEASLPGRNAFCMRDVSHMSLGAQFLGLGSRTANMLRRFAANISAAKKWCSWWEITRDNLPAPVDYNNDRDFWYDLPANFDVLDACYRQWLWTRDDAWLDDVFLNFYRHTVTDYVKAWDRDGNGLLEHLRSYGHRGIATYDEDLQDEILVGADLIATQYAAYRDYAAIARIRNASAEADEFDRKAEGLHSLYNNQWWDEAHNRFFGALGEDGRFHSDLKEGNGRCTVELPLYYRLTAAGPKARASLDLLEKRLAADLTAQQGAVGGVEGRSYMPEIFYKYGRSSAGYSALTAMMDPALQRREYPEVSYTAIGSLASGLMGIRPLAAAQTIETFPQLTSETTWAALHHVPVGRGVISVRHDGNGQTALTNESGPGLDWRAVFPGRFRALFRDGREIPAAHTLPSNGNFQTYSTVHAGPGETCVLRVTSG
jgi:hypothetical protein